MKPKTDLSVVICTYNRAQSLEETLESLVRQESRSGISWEIVVVDNNSSDATRAGVQEFQARTAIPIRYVFEGQQGVAFARNAGIRNSKGEVIAYLDDDVVADPGWLDGIWSAFSQTNAEAVGGRILRLWNMAKPDWFSEEIGGCLISQDWGLDRKPMTDIKRHMVTANMAFRKSVFSQYGYFREELGRRGDSLLGGEDRELYQRLVREGSLVLYEPKALVHHKVEEDRLTPAYFRRWFREIGETLGHEMPAGWTLVPLWVWKDFFGSLFSYLKSRHSSASQKLTSELYLIHRYAMLRERFYHAVPVLKKHCAFERRNTNVNNLRRSEWEPNLQINQS